ncbi:hypothetical protein ACL02T_31720 [Pseudonocardia sp. RS010]|uniref:hypothetical protein n=1 Tax=Pseudonocardia sp. RS010 TaxID=3385979 RepID=UPI00399FB88D
MTAAARDARASAEPLDGVVVDDLVPDRVVDEDAQEGVVGEDTPVERVDSCPEPPAETRSTTESETVDEADTVDEAATTEATDQDEVADTADTPDSATLGPRRGIGRGRRRLLVALAAAAVLLLGATVWAGALFLGDRATDQRKAAVLDTARTVGATLTTISHDTAKQDIQRVVDASTGDFGDLFRSNTQAYVGVIKDGAVTSTGKVDEAGIQSLDGDTAKTLVAVSSTVKNKTVPDGEQRYYRMMIEMKHQDDGRWLVSNVEFVP